MVMGPARLGTVSDCTAIYRPVLSSERVSRRQAFRGFSQSVQENYGIISRLHRVRFLPNNSQFIIPLTHLS
jgi:hypothetical protein